MTAILEKMGKSLLGEKADGITKTVSENKEEGKKEVIPDD
jgi:hypothetical protein